MINNKIRNILNYKQKRYLQQYIEQLKFIPEFNIGNDLQLKGQWKNSLPNFYRVKDIMKNSLGSSSDLTALTSLKIASSHRQLGEYDLALKSLDFDNYSPLFKIRSLHEIALCKLLQGSAEDSYNLSKQSTDICESLRDPDYELFAPSYGLQGLSLLLLGKYTNAEELLQMSARWSDHPTTQIISLVNLGYLSQAQTMSMIPLIPNFPTKESIANSRESRLKVMLVQEAIDYWQEGIDLAIKSCSSTPNSTPNSMCGPTESFSPAGPGMETISVASNETTTTTSTTTQGVEVHKSGSKSNSSTNEGIFEKKLIDDIDFAIAYTGALCNIAEGSIALGDTNRASDCLSSGLKALQAHSANDSKASPVLSRCLMLMGCNHLHAAEAITAEGLFRNALDRLQTSPYALNNPRHNMEMARVLKSYGSLLKKWDKREKLGDEYIARSDQIISQLPVYFNDMRLSQMLQLPIE